MPRLGFSCLGPSRPRNCREHLPGCLRAATWSFFNVWEATTVVLQLREAKNDQFSRGQVRTHHLTGSPICPVLALRDHARLNPHWLRGPALPVFACKGKSITRESPASGLQHCVGVPPRTCGLTQSSKGRSYSLVCCHRQYGACQKNSVVGNQTPFMLTCTRTFMGENNVVLTCSVRSLLYSPSKGPIVPPLMLAVCVRLIVGPAVLGWMFHP